MPPTNRCILARIDNTVVVLLINKQGLNKTTSLNELLSRLLLLCSNRNWILRACHLPGQLNAWANSISRNPQSAVNGVTVSLLPEDCLNNPSSDKSVCPSMQQETGNVREPLPLSNSNSGRCSLIRQEQVDQHLPVPSSRPDTNLPAEAEQLQGQGTVCGSSTPVTYVVAGLPQEMQPIARQPRNPAIRTRQKRPGSRRDVLGLLRLQFLTLIYDKRFHASVSHSPMPLHFQYENCWNDYPP